MMYWKLLYGALQLMAVILPFLQKGKGVDMRPLSDLERMRRLSFDMEALNRKIPDRPVDWEITPFDDPGKPGSEMRSERKFR